MWMMTKGWERWDYAWSSGIRFVLSGHYSIISLTTPYFRCMFIYWGKIAICSFHFNFLLLCIYLFFLGPSLFFGPHPSLMGKGRTAGAMLTFDGPHSSYDNPLALAQLPPSYFLNCNRLIYDDECDANLLDKIKSHILLCNIISVDST
jgi:hypothetical protein